MATEIIVRASSARARRAMERAIGWRLRPHYKPSTTAGKTTDGYDYFILTEEQWATVQGVAGITRAPKSVTVESLSLST